MDKQTKALGTYYAILDQSTACRGRRPVSKSRPRRRCAASVPSPTNSASRSVKACGRARGHQPRPRRHDPERQRRRRRHGAVRGKRRAEPRVLADAVILLNNQARNSTTSAPDEWAAGVTKYPNKLTLLGGALAPTAAFLDLVTRETLEQKYAFENTAHAAEALTGSIQRLAAANRLLAESQVSDFATVAANKYYRDAGVRAKKLQDDLEATAEATQKLGGSVSSVSNQVNRDLTTLLNDFEYTTVEFGRKTAKLSQKQDTVFEGMLTAFTAKVQKQEQIIADTLQQIEDAAAYAKTPSPVHRRQPGRLH